MAADNRESAKGSERRAFFRRIALFSGAVAFGTVCGAYAGVKRKTADSGTQSQESGYRETEHIRRYYERAST
jgi:hypothetical protein